MQMNIFLWCIRNFLSRSHLLQNTVMTTTKLTLTKYHSLRIHTEKFKLSGELASWQAETLRCSDYSSLQVLLLQQSVTFDYLCLGSSWVLNWLMVLAQCCPLTNINKTIADEKDRGQTYKRFIFVDEVSQHTSIWSVLVPQWWAT